MYVHNTVGSANDYSVTIENLLHRIPLPKISREKNRQIKKKIEKKLYHTANISPG